MVQHNLKVGGVLSLLNHSADTYGHISWKVKKTHTHVSSRVLYHSSKEHSYLFVFVLKPAVMQVSATSFFRYALLSQAGGRQQ